MVYQMTALILCQRGMYTFIHVFANISCKQGKLLSLAFLNMHDLLYLEMVLYNSITRHFSGIWSKKHGENTGHRISVHSICKFTEKVYFNIY